jgi:hypothetical protein
MRKIELLGKVALIIILALSLNSCSTGEAINDWEKWGLKGKVESITRSTYKAVDRFGNIEKEGKYFPTIRRKYDESGYIIEVIVEEFDNVTPATESKFKYDENRNVIESNVYNSDGSLDGMTAYKYDDSGNEIESSTYNSGGYLESKTNSKYDDSGNEIESSTYNSGGRLQFKNTYKYDGRGNNIETNDYQADGSLEYKDTRKFDENGNVIESNVYNSDGSLDGKSTFSYDFDNKGNWIKKIQFRNEIAEYIIEREYEYYE